jgi:hypothetical protein
MARIVRTLVTVAAVERRRDDWHKNVGSDDSEGVARVQTTRTPKQLLGNLKAL